MKTVSGAAFLAGYRSVLWVTAHSGVVIFRRLTFLHSLFPFTSSSNSSELEFPSYCYSWGGGFPMRLVQLLVLIVSIVNLTGSRVIEDVSLFEYLWEVISIMLAEVRRLILNVGSTTPPAWGSMLNRKWSGHQVSLFSASRLQMQCVQQPLSPAATPSLP